MMSFGVSSAAGGLPEPDPAAAAHGARVAAHLEARIDAEGPLTFARFMEEALYAPGLGYYAAGAAKLGAEGDFVTAPELTPLFGEVLARPVGAALEALGGGDVLELGAGTGALAAALLPALARAGAPLGRYRILEVSPDLRARQGARLEGLEGACAAPVAWEEALPMGFRGVILANEVADALPVHRVRIDVEGDREWYVARGDEGLAWRLGAPSSEAVAQGLGRIRALLGGAAELPYDTELGLAAGGWVRSLGEALGAGLVLVMDYGYPRRELYHPQRRQGTLACHYRHRRHGDALALPGLQDITAHVDFTTLAEAAAEAGLRVAGLATQARFLLDQGLLERLPRDASPADPGWVAMAQAVRRLLLPGEMGELVKVLALTRGIDPPPGIGGPDLRARL